MFRTILAAGLCLLAGVARGQTTATISGFSGPGGGFVTHMEGFNGQWSAAQIKPVQLCPNVPGHQIGAMVSIEMRHRQVVVTLHRPVATPSGVQYVGIGVFGLPTGATSGTINVNAYPGDPRQIVVQ